VIVSLPNNLPRSSRSLVRLILTDVQFWLPIAILLVGIGLLIFLDKQ